MRSDELVTIAGKRGYGKTTAAKELVQGLSRIQIWDPMGEYDNSYTPVSGSIEEFNTFLKSIWIRGNCFVLVDEADQVMPELKPLCLYANKIVNLGRHRNIGMGMITRRIAVLNKNAFAQSSMLVLFHHFAPNDIRYLSEFIPTAEELIKLQKYQYKVYQL